MKKFFFIILLVIIFLMTSTQQAVIKTNNSAAEILPDPVVIAQAIRQLNRLETVSMPVEEAIPDKRDTDRWWGMFGESMLFMAYGEVIAGVDFNKIEDDDLQVIDAKTIRIKLPKAEILHTIVSTESHPASREKGILAQVDLNLETKLRKKAENYFTQAALKMGILETVDRNAKNNIEIFIKKLGFNSQFVL